MYMDHFIEKNWINDGNIHKKEQTFQGLLPIQFSKLHLKKFNKKFQYQKLTDRDVQKFHEYVIRLNCLK